MQTALIVAIEHEFHTIFPDRAFDSFKTPDDIVKYIQTWKMAI